MDVFFLISPYSTIQILELSSNFPDLSTDFPKNMFFSLSYTAFEHLSLWQYTGCSLPRPETFQAGRALDLEVELRSRQSIIASLIDHIRSSHVSIHNRLIRCVNLTVAVEVRRGKERAAGEETGPVAWCHPPAHSEWSGRQRQSHRRHSNRQTEPPYKAQPALGLYP